MSAPAPTLHIPDPDAATLHHVRSFGVLLMAILAGSLLFASGFAAGTVSSTALSRAPVHGASVEW